MKNIEIRLFGAFRKYIPSGVISVMADRSFTVIEVKSKVLQQIQAEAPGFSDDSLIHESALANEEEILSEDMIVGECLSFALLPPVCGG